MTGRTALSGTCHICKETVTKRTAASHLQKTHAGKSGEERYIIKVDTPYSSPYWMFLLAKPGATLADLDEALRDIWVECCGHLSAFSIMGTEYQASYDGDVSDPIGDAKSMKVQLKKILTPAMSFTYEYDFGTTTELRLHVVDTITWQKEKEEILMIAMNNKPEHVCSECGKPAIFHYVESDDETYLCIDCGSEEELDECYLLPICNSPRTGQCAYEGGRFDTDEK